MIDYLFHCILPFRMTLLSMLLPSDIARLLVAINSQLTIAERGRYMNILDEIFEDSSPILAMQKSGLTVRIFGADLTSLQNRLIHSNAHTNIEDLRRPLHIFILVSDVVNGLATLVRDHRLDKEQGLATEDMCFSQLHDTFGDEIAHQISSFSPFVLCAPYLAGSMPNAVPGWIPMFNTRPFINVRAYISTYDDCNGRLLVMDRLLMGRVFGYDKPPTPVLSIADSVVPCYRYHLEGMCLEQLKGELSFNTLHDVLAVATQESKKPDDDYVIVHMLHPLNAAITINIKQ